MKKDSSKDKPVKVNLDASTKILQRQLLKYLVPVEHKVDNRGARDKLWKIFLNAKKPKLIETYEALKKQIGTNGRMDMLSTLGTSKVTIGDAKPSPKKDYLLNVVLYSDQAQFSGQKAWKGLYMMFPKDPHRQYQVKAPKIFPQSIVKQVIRRDMTKKEAKLFKLGTQIFLTDDEFNEFYDKKVQYIVAFKIFTVDSIEPAKSKHKPLDKSLKDIQKISMNNKYIETKFDTSINTFKEAIAKTPYTINECWLNTIIDVYGDSLMSGNKRQVVNREKILQTIGKTEETVKDGISVNDILPF
jgi:hypothetical protein